MPSTRLASDSVSAFVRRASFHGRGLLAAVVLATATGCGPWGPMGVIAGGALVGEEASEPAAEACDAQTLLAALETRGRWFRHSVTLFCVAHEGVVYIPARGGGAKRWTRNALADPRVRLAIDSAIHHGRLTRVRSVEDDVAKAFVRKIAGVEVENARFLLSEPGPGDDRTALWLFRFDENPS